MKKQLTIGLFGFGVVGEGIYKVIQDTPALRAVISKVCIKHPDKPRNADRTLFTTDRNDILNDPAINVVIELIDNAEEAFEIVSTALKNGKAVVSANKKMIAAHFPQLIQLQQDSGCPLLYEASVCGSIPVIRNLEEYYDNDLLQSVCGIVNGSTNYILTKIKEDNISYTQALLQAQAAGFAESDPSLDVEGYDAANKLIILVAHAYGVLIEPSHLLFKGIKQLSAIDSSYAAEKKYVIKLTAHARKLKNGKLAAYVLPQFVTPESQLSAVHNEYNGVIIESKLADKQFLYGKGAGRYPTSSAVLSDVAALRYDYKYEYRRLHASEKPIESKDYFLNVYVSFNNWQDLNKGDFEAIDEFHSTQDRQYILGTIQAEKLFNAPWFHQPTVSLVVLPGGLVENEAVVIHSSKNVSLELAGV